MGEDKGKGPEQVEQGVQQPIQENAEPSVLSRIITSATGLARNAFTAPRSDELGQTLATAMGDSGKAVQNGSSSNSTYFESSGAVHSQNVQSGGSNPFKSTHQSEHTYQAEREFSSFLNGIPPFTPSQDKSTELTNEETPLSWGDAWARSQHHELPAEESSSTSIFEQETNDGAEVLAILSAPSLDQLQDTYDGVLENSEYDWGLTSEQLQQVLAITKELFPNPPRSHAPMPADHPLNLIPAQETTDATMSSPQNETSFDEFYLSQPIPFSQLWYTQWSSVLTSYTDEVWGGLLPLVQDARDEVESAPLKAEGERSEEPVALRRLRAVLGHLRGQ